MKRRKLVVLVAAALASPGVHGANKAFNPPITFERNEGQFLPEVLFAARGVSRSVVRDLEGARAVAHGDVEGFRWR